MRCLLVWLKRLLVQCSVILTAMAAYALTIKSLPFRRTISFS